MQVQLPSEPLTKCKEAVQEFLKKCQEFREIGGYLIGIYDGIFTIKEFILDENAQSTTTRLKLSAECFQQVEDRLSKNPTLQYIGTWHVHPGKMKPAYSTTDVSTLFLEKLVIETDNPKEFQCPRIHLIFNEDMSQVSAFTMQINLEYQLMNLSELKYYLRENDINRIDEIIEKLQIIKKDLKSYQNNQESGLLDNCFDELGIIRDEVDQLLDLIEDTSTFQEFFTIIQKEKNNIEKKLKSLIKKGETLGIITMVNNKTLNLDQYRPSLIEEHLEDGTLLGFWKHYLVAHPPIEFQKIFIANFFRKLHGNSEESFIYILSAPSTIQFYGLKILELSGISFEEITITQEEIP